MLALTTEEYKSTLGKKMIDVTQTVEPVIDIWPYIKQLVEENIILSYVFDNELVEAVYRNSENTFNHILIPTEKENIFIVLVLNLALVQLVGYYRLDLEQEYRINFLQ